MLLIFSYFVLFGCCCCFFVFVEVVVFFVAAAIVDAFAVAFSLLLKLFFDNNVVLNVGFLVFFCEFSFVVDVNVVVSAVVTLFLMRTVNIVLFVFVLVVIDYDVVVASAVLWLLLVLLL